MKRATNRLHIGAETIRQLGMHHLVAINGGRPRLSSPTDEMGECGPCHTLNTCSCTTPPPVV